MLLLLTAPLVVEGGLRLFGIGYPTAFVIRKGDYWFPNERFAQQFFGPRATSRPVYFRIPVRKAADTARIIVLGESAAMGTPDPAFSFGRILEVMLERRFPGKKIELVNGAMRGIDSHVVRQIAHDCARLQPDLFIVYMGNNEVIGLHGPEPGCSRWSQSLGLIRTAQWIKSTRLGQLLGRASVLASRVPATQDMEFFRKHRLLADDWRRETVRRNFAANLQDICRAAAKRNAHVIVCTVPVNIKDFPPLGSLETRNAGGSGDLNAETQFRMAQQALAAGETNKAVDHFQRALDYDALQFRADRPLNQRISQVTAKFPRERVTLVDAVRAFAEADGGSPGARLFRDHVHPTFEGDYLIAQTLLPAVETRLGTLNPEPRTPKPVLSRDECADLLAYTIWHDAQIQLAVADLTSRPPYHDQLNYRERQIQAETAARDRLARLTGVEGEAALQTSLAAVKQRPDDWMLRYNCVQLYQALGRPVGAIEHLEAITKMFPHAVSFQILLAHALTAAGRIDDAIRHLEQALKLDPNDARAREALAQLRQHAAPK